MDSWIDLYNIFAGFVEGFYTDFFFWVLNTSISASFLVVAIIILRLILKKAPKAMIVALWGMVAIRLICPFSLESALSLIPSEETIPTEQFQYQETRHDDYELQIVSNPIYPEEVDYKMPGTVENNSIKSIYAYFCWLGGMGIMLIYSATSYIVIKRKVRVSAPYKENILICDGIKTPFILGVFKPKIYLPSDIPDEEKEFVIAHEKAHLKRRDHWWKPLGFILLSLHWFNPLMWVAYVFLCRDIEFACDEKVIKSLGEEGKKPYSDALLNCSVPRKMITACPVAFGETGVKSRIKSVLNYKKPAFWVILIAVILSIVLAVCFMTNPVKNKSIFNAKYETGKCLYSYVVSKDKESRIDLNSYSINASGGVYKDFGNGEGEYIGELKESAFTVAEMNQLLNNEGESSIYLGRVAAVYEIKNENSNKNSIDYVFIQKKNGDTILINFFTNGNIMSIFELDLVKRFDDETSSEIMFKKNLSLSDVITLSDKKDNLTWSDFEEFRYIETGSGLYIRHYEIDEMFSLLIGGSGPDEEPMYIYLHASDEWDFQIDIRQSDVEAFINEHQKNPVVKNLSASWHCIPVGYNENTYSKIIETYGVPSYAILNRARFVPVVKIEDADELQSFMQKMNGYMSFDIFYPDAPSFNEVKAEYNEEFFGTSSLLLAYTSSPTTAHRYTVDNIKKSEGVVTVNIAEIEPEGGDTAMEGWLVAVRVSKEDITDAEKIDALINTVYLNQMHLDNAVKTAISQKNSESILKGEYNCAAFEILKSETLSDESQNHKIKLYLTTCYASYSTKNNELETMGLISEPAVMTLVQDTDGTFSLVEYYVPIKGDNSDEAKKLHELSLAHDGKSLSEICRMDAQKHLGTKIKSEESQSNTENAEQIIELRLEDVLSKEISSVEVNSSTRLLREQEPIRVTEEQKEKIVSYISNIGYDEAVDYQRGFGSNYIVKLNYTDGSSVEIVFMDKYFYIYSSDGQSVIYADETENSINLIYYIVNLIS